MRVISVKSSQNNSMLTITMALEQLESYSAQGVTRLLDILKQDRSFLMPPKTTLPTNSGVSERTTGLSQRQMGPWSRRIDVC
jgi:hypothetical protein